MQFRTSRFQIVSSTAPQHTNDSVQIDDTHMSFIVVLLPLLVMFGLIVQRGYRAVLLRKHVDTLEKLWRLDTTTISER